MQRPCTLTVQRKSDFQTADHFAGHFLYQQFGLEAFRWNQNFIFIDNMKVSVLSQSVHMIDILWRFKVHNDILQLHVTH